MSNNNIFENIDIENAATSVVWSAEKARCILSDVHDYFVCENPKHPDADTLNNIKYAFSTIYTKLSIVADMLDGIEEAIKPVNDAIDAKYKRF